MGKKILLYIYFFNYLVVLFFWFRVSYPLFANPDVSSIMLAFGRLAGLTSVFLVLTQLLLIGRIKWIERLWGHDKLAVQHRKDGRYILYALLTHFLLILGSHAISADKDVINQLLDFFYFYDDTFWAFVALILFVSIALLSIYIKRLKLKYETWYFIHLLMYLAIALAYLHQAKNGGTLTQTIFSYYWIALYVFVFTNLLFFRFSLPVFNLLRLKFRVVKVVKEGGGATSVYIEGRDLTRFKRIAGQFVIVRFLDNRRWWQAHPFSLSWGSKNEYLRLTIKDSGDFTHEIPRLRVGTTVLVDGPHGRFAAADSHATKFLFIAGGIGVTPLRSMLEDIERDRDCIFIWSNKLRGEVPLLPEVQHLCKSAGIPLTLFYSEEKIERANELVGHIDEKRLKQLVTDIRSREVYLCGPEGFMDAIIEILVKLGVAKEKIHFEKFSFH